MSTTDKFLKKIMKDCSDPLKSILPEISKLNDKDIILLRDWVDFIIIWNKTNET